MYKEYRIENTVDAVTIGLIRGPDWRLDGDHLYRHHPAVFRSFAATQSPVFAVKNVLRLCTRQKVWP